MDGAIGRWLAVRVAAVLRRPWLTLVLALILVANLLLIPALLAGRRPIDS